MAKRKQDIICISEGPFKVGDQMPTGYNAKLEWANVQHKAGLRQVRRPECGRFHFPHENCRHVV